MISLLSLRLNFLPSFKFSFFLSSAHSLFSFFLDLRDLLLIEKQYTRVNEYILLMNEPNVRLNSPCPPSPSLLFSPHHPYPPSYPCSPGNCSLICALVHCDSVAAVFLIVIQIPRLIGVLLFYHFKWWFQASRRHGDLSPCVFVLWSRVRHTFCYIEILQTHGPS